MADEHAVEHGVRDAAYDAAYTELCRTRDLYDQTRAKLGDCAATQRAYELYDAAATDFVEVVMADPDAGPVGPDRGGDRP